MAQIDSSEIKSSTPRCARISLILGLIGPVAFLLLLFAIKISSSSSQSSSGMGGLGLVSLFVLIVGIILLLSIPLGIAAIIFGVHALSIAKKENAQSSMSTIGIVIGCFDVVVPIILFFLTVLPR